MNIEKLIKGKTPDIRHLKEMGSVIYDKEWKKSADNTSLYFMYRGIKEENNLRYDITIIPHRLLGKEYVKTKGHRHLEKEEVYEVLKGEAIFLLQRYDEREDKIREVYAVKAQKGEYISIPPTYDHITINPSLKEDLILGNWISPEAKSIYDILQKKKGACYFYTLSGWVKNKNYKDIPPLIFKEPLKEPPKSLSF